MGFFSDATGERRFVFVKGFTLSFKGFRFKEFEENLKNTEKIILIKT